MKIYAITKGYQSDFRICALTVSKDKAELLKRKYTDSYKDTEIQEFDEEENLDKDVFWVYSVKYGVQFLGEGWYGERVCEDWKSEKVSHVYLYAKDAEHAEKKAQDMIAEYKARKEGIC